jgi:hypothetical protein
VPKPDRSGQETRQTASGPVLNVIYFGDECDGCELASLCRKAPHAKNGRKVTRDEHEDDRRVGAECGIHPKDVAKDEAPRKNLL